MLRNSAWDALHLGYFLGYACWNYFTTPFLFAYPGVHVREDEPWREAGQHWRRLQVRFPPQIATHNPDQVFYFDTLRLQRRLGYIAESQRQHPRRPLHQPLQVFRWPARSDAPPRLPPQPRQHRQPEPAVHHPRHPLRRADPVPPRTNTPNTTNTRPTAPPPPLHTPPLLTPS